MKITLEEAERQLLTVNAAIEALIAGKRLNQLRVGSGTFARLYVFSEITLENLKQHRDELLSVIGGLEDVAPEFTKNMHIPLIVSKEIF